MKLLECMMKDKDAVEREKGIVRGGVIFTKEEHGNNGKRCSLCKTTVVF